MKLKNNPSVAGVWRVLKAVAACLLFLVACGRQGFEVEKTPCDGVDCAGHGTCVLVADQARCLCDEGYEEKELACSEITVPINPCVGVTCSGWGTCAVRNNEAYCVCAEGYHSPPDDKANCVADKQPCEGADGTPCDDGQFCTINDTCIGGVCIGSPGKCDDGDSCTVDTCDEVDETCTHTAAADGSPCDDGDYCTVAEFCTAGVCAGGVGRNCSDGNPCTDDSCDSAIAHCVNTVVPDGTACSNQIFCIVGESCASGVCGGGSPRDCSDANGCTFDTCNEATDACEHQPVVDGTPCDDGLFCTIGDICSNGACIGSGARDCSDDDPCTLDSCDEASAQCVHDTAGANGTPCDDGLFCTVSETCTNGACQGGSPRNCDDSNPCTVDSCDEANHACKNDGVAANGVPCDDGLFCNVGETCSNGMCQGGSPRNCSDGNPCTVDTCDEVNDRCVNDTAAGNGKFCSNGHFCTVGETCLSGVCQGGSPNPCDDGNDCTVDSCDAVNSVCKNDPTAANGNACVAGLYCLQNQTCLDGLCQGGTPRDCSDSNPCTADTCDETNDKCLHTPIANGGACSNGLYCTVGETCTGGACGGGSARNCSDSNPCTVDTCDEPTHSCLHTNATNGTVCDDGLFCTTGTTCTNGTCGGGSPNLCDDSNACTLDSCNEAAKSCTHDAASMNGVACSTGKFCIIGEKCNASACGGGSVRTCDDSNSCTADSCDETNRICVNAARPNGTACDDGKFCTTGDSCSGGACQSGAGSPCTANPCATGCDEVNDACSGCTPAGKRCMSSAEEATCDGACDITQLVICQYGCNSSRQQCNQCSPSSTVCQADAEYLCNAKFVCDANGLLQSKTCCTSDRCSCNGTMCLEDLCTTAPDVSAGGTFTGNTCSSQDNIPGDCNPGGAACKSVANGGAPENFFRFTLNNGQPTSAFYNVTLDTAGSALDSTLRVSTVCGSETNQVPNATVCAGTPGTVPEKACYEHSGPETMLLCGLPEGSYFGAVDSALGTCGAYTMNVTVQQANLDTASQAGNISMGGTFIGNTCSLTDNYQFPDTTSWSTAGGTGCDCVNVGGGTQNCPACGVAAARDCTLTPNGYDDWCTYSGKGSKDAVFYLALAVESGIDISTWGSDFDTVLYIMQTGPTGANPPGAKRVCSDDCWYPNGPSHIQTSLPAGLYYVYVDGAGGACGNYVLDVSISPAAVCPNLHCEAPYENCTNCAPDCTCPHCGDGVVNTDEGEQCDDGNTNNGDCCNNRCAPEAGCACCGQPSTCRTSFAVNGNATCNCAIPDGTNSGCGTARTSTITVPGTCLIADLSVDVNITHPYISDLTVQLTSPNGTHVMLHNRSGGGTANIVGTYDDTLPIDGPGNLSDFFCGPGNGTWTLTVQDCVRIDTGTLNTWALHLTCI